MASTDSLSLIESSGLHDASPTDIRRECCFYLQTIQPNTIKTLVDALKEITADCNIVFDKTGVLVKTVDAPQNAMIHMRLYAEKFENYICNGSYVCGIALLHLYKIIKTMTSTDILMVFMRKDNKGVLEFRIENTLKAKTCNYELFLLDLPRASISAKKPEFPHAISMQAVEFHKIVRDMKDMCTKMEVRCHRNTIRFSTVEGTFANAMIHVSMKKPDDEPRSDQIEQGVFSLKYLSMFTKCTSLSKTVDIYLKNDYPLIIQYQVSTLGSIRFVLMMEENDY